MTDDQGWGDIHSHGNEKLDTPTMDRIAGEGVRWDRFYASPMCGPTRASLLTGRWNLRTGASWVSHGKEIVRLDEVTIAEAFKAAGYATGAFGKWHNGEYGPYHPNDRGFDQFTGFCRGAWENYFDAVIEENRKPLQTQGYITDVLTDAALEFIKHNKDGPFFCYIPYNAPHHPFQVPQRYFNKYKERGFVDKTAAVYAMVENIDDNLKRILDRLDDWELEERTIVIFTSDNGPAGIKRYNGGMRGIKASVDEGGVRVPFFMRWPGQLPAGTTVCQLSAHVDIFPTLVEMCGIPMPETLRMDGRSMFALLNGNDPDWSNRMIFSHQNQFGDTLPVPGAVRTERYRLVNRGKGYELYDMSMDPGQTTDVAEFHPETTRQLAEAYESWYAEVTSRGVEPPPLPVGYPAGKVTALQAEDARITGNLKFRRGKGWAHDSILNWTDAETDSVTWKTDIQATGRYQITLMVGCLEADVGTRIRTEINGQNREVTIRNAHDPMPKIEKARSRNSIWTSGPVPVMTWMPVQAGSLKLDKGLVDIKVRIASGKAQSFELKEIRLNPAL